MLLTSVFANAQRYEFTELSEEYTNLEMSEELTVGADAIWDDPQFVVPIGFEFTLMDSVVNHVIISEEREGSEVYLTSNPEDSGLDRPYISVYGNDLIDLGDYDEVHLPPISFLTEGAIENRIFKLEWENFTLTTFSEEESVEDRQQGNIQLWLYENSNVVEIHNGVSSFTTTAYDLGGPQIGIGYLSGEDEILESFHIFVGEVDALTLDYGTIEIDFVDDGKPFSGVPADGAVYRFSPLEEISGVDEFADEHSALIIYPNPTKNQIQLTGLSSDANTGFI